jgi:hypothetical protein
LTTRAIRLLHESADRFVVPAFQIDGPEMRAAIALRPKAKRQTIYERSVPIWPELGELRKPQQLAFAEAAVTALVGDVKRALAE